MNESANTKSQNKILIISITAVALGAGFLFSGSESDVKIIENTQSSMVKNDYQPLTIAQAWQENLNKKTSNQNTPSKPQNQAGETQDNESENTPSLDYTYIQKEIGKIRLSEDGTVILDEMTLSALRDAFPVNHLNLTPEMLQELQEILKQGLPGIAGEQAAEIVSNFYEYMEAKKDLNDLFRDVQVKPGTHEEALAEEKALRELYLGKEIADQLFKKEDQTSEYMLKAFRIASDQSLSHEEKEKEKNKLNIEFINNEIENWDARYQSYLEEKNTLKAKQLSTEEYNQAVIQLRNQHFSVQEQARISDANIPL